VLVADAPSGKEDSSRLATDVAIELERIADTDDAWRIWAFDYAS
jgi:hypothetical protein